jgi:signal transduction histidine kinase
MVEGVIGLAVNITDRKRAEDLELQNKVQEAELKERERFQILTEQVAHEVETPLQTMDLILRGTENLSKREHMTLKDSAYNIRKTMQTFLECSSYIKDNLDLRHIPISQALAEIIERKKRYYSGENVEFQYSFDPALETTFIYGNASSFELMISNVIDNSVEAFEGKSGAIKISFAVDDNNVTIVIHDNGKAMPQEIVEKLMRNESVTTTDVDDFDINTDQIQDILREFKGSLFIESTPNVGTKIMLTIPKSDKPI